MNAQYASVSAKYANERRVSKDEAEQLSNDLAYLGLSACGGNTLIGAKYVQNKYYLHDILKSTAYLNGQIPLRRIRDGESLKYVPI